MAKEITLRPILPSDNEVLSRIIKGVFMEHPDAPRGGTVFSDPTTDHLFELFQAEQSVLWVAEIENKIAGCGGIFPTAGLPDGCVELVKFYLHASARGKGVGRALMEKSIESAKEFGFKSIYIESLPQFDKAVNIYLKQGFKQLDRPLGQSGHTGCNIWMVKEIG